MFRNFRRNRLSVMGMRSKVGRLVTGHARVIILRTGMRQLLDNAMRYLHQLVEVASASPHPLAAMIIDGLSG